MQRSIENRKQLSAGANRPGNLTANDGGVPVLVQAGALPIVANDTVKLAALRAVMQFVSTLRREQSPCSSQCLSSRP